MVARNLLMVGGNQVSLDAVSSTLINGGYELRNVLTTWAWNSGDGLIPDATTIEYNANYSYVRRYSSSMTHNIAPRALPTTGNANVIIPRTRKTTVVMLNHGINSASGANSFVGPAADVSTSTQQVAENMYHYYGLTFSLRMNTWNVPLSYNNLGTNTFTWTKSSINYANFQYVAFLPWKYQIIDSVYVAGAAATTNVDVQKNDIVYAYNFGVVDGYVNGGSVTWQGGANGVRINGPYDRWYTNYENDWYVVTASGGKAVVTRNYDNAFSGAIVLRPY